MNIERLQEKFKKLLDSPEITDKEREQYDKVSTLQIWQEIRNDHQKLGRKIMELEQKIKERKKQT